MKKFKDMEQLFVTVGEVYNFVKDLPNDYVINANKISIFYGTTRKLSEFIEFLKKQNPNNKLYVRIWSYDCNNNREFFDYYLTKYDLSLDEEERCIDIRLTLLELEPRLLNFN